MKSFTLIGVIVLLLGISSQTAAGQRKDAEISPPNILWITCEDISPYLGGYGYEKATTPNLDKLASEGVLYTNTFANVPVCAPVRFTLITGSYASSCGTQNMRSTYRIPSDVNNYVKHLNSAGYYCTNNTKTDYNTSSINKSIWDESSNKAHYKNRPEGKPFFAIFNITNCHESRLHSYSPGSLRHDPQKMDIPPYLPDVIEVRNDWAREYDVIEDMDASVGNLLVELDNLGLSDNTIVIYYSDHGGLLGRSKRFIYDTGTRVPLIVRVPEAYRDAFPATPNTTSDRLVSLIDMGPTAISMAGGMVPEYMQGNIFLGPEKSEDPEYVYFIRNRMDERIDFMRGLCDKRYRYIRNFMPHRPLGQYLSYLWKAPNVQAWDREYKAGNCNEVQSRFWQLKPPEELYDMVNDKWEVVNLADNPEYADVLNRFRQVLSEKMIETGDVGFIPEGEVLAINNTGKSVREYASNDQNYPLSDIIDMALLSSDRNVQNIPQLLEGLSSDNKFVRYWAATGFAILRDQSTPAKEKLKMICSPLTADPSVDVRVTASEALFFLNEKELAFSVLRTALGSSNIKLQLHALNVIQSLGSEAILSLEGDISTMLNRDDEYIKGASNYALQTKNSAEIISTVNPVIPDKDYQSDFILYPNPVGQNLDLSNFESIEDLKVINSNGELVIAKRNVSDTVFSVSGLPAGIYFLIILDKMNHTFVNKFIKI